MFLKIVILLLVLLVLGSFLEKLLRKRFGIEKEKGFLYKHVNDAHKWGEWIITLLFIIGFTYISYNDESSVKVYQFFITYLIISAGFRMFMEWKYSLGSKKYILTFMSLVLILICVLLLYSFNILDLL